MTKSKSLAIGFAMLALTALGTIGIWGMGPAVFLDSERTILSTSVSPDGKRIAQVERLTVGGVPNIVVTVRSWWSPNWYLAGCAATSHYDEISAKTAWISDTSLAVSTDDLESWNADLAPFQRACRNLKTRLTAIPRKS